MIPETLLWESLGFLFREYLLVSLVFFGEMVVLQSGSFYALYFCSSLPFVNHCLETGYEGGFMGIFGFDNNG